MKLDDYVAATVKTKAPGLCAQAGGLQGPLIDLQHAVLGLTTEWGEFLDPIKKALFYGKPLDYVHLAEEVGDACWYNGIAAYIIPEHREMMRSCIENQYSEHESTLPEYRSQHTMRMEAFLREKKDHQIFVLYREASTAMAIVSDINMGTAHSFWNMWRECSEYADPALYVREVYSRHYRAQFKKQWVTTLDIASWLGFPIERIFESNVAKLFKRYGDKFSEECAQFRTLSDERAILEEHHGG